ncbi:MAG: L-seryl-tRNA(Sec) selenium transferase [Thermoflexales bacterium]|nr:L-seryl-tRNA(Sec) selenium transferase [Thermoflexales bacterium]
MAPDPKNFRALPSVSDLLEAAGDLVAAEGQQRTTFALRARLGAARNAIRTGAPAPTRATLLAEAAAALAADAQAASARPVINATGVILHTNLGRAPLSAAAQTALIHAAAGYSALEFDVGQGERGPRGGGVEALLCALTGAQAALVVNNCAAATTLMLAAHAAGRGVVIARGQLVEIGGGFRVPEVLKQSGARLIEVGTTNRVHPNDYAEALADPNADAAAILRAHPSNFRVSGFTAEVGLAEMVDLARATGRPVAVLDDLGSGPLVDTSTFGLAREPMPQDSLQAGVDVVAFSGDKLLGGPQAGILVGRAEAITRCRRHPLQRAVRADKLTLAALGATLLHYARGEAAREVPIVRMMALPVDVIAQRAEAVIADLRDWLAANGLAAALIDGRSTVGGGSLPGETLPTRLITLKGQPPDAQAARLRAAPVPIVARIVDDALALDLRTVLDDRALCDNLRRTR